MLFAPKEKEKESLERMHVELPAGVTLKELQFSEQELFLRIERAQNFYLRVLDNQVDLGVFNGTADYPEHERKYLRMLFRGMPPAEVAKLAVINGRLEVLEEQKMKEEMEAQRAQQRARINALLTNPFLRELPEKIRRATTSSFTSAMGGSLTNSVI